MPMPKAQIQRLIFVFSIIAVTNTALAGKRDLTLRPYILINNSTLDLTPRILDENSGQSDKTAKYSSNSAGETGISFSWYGFSIGYGTESSLNEDDIAKKGETKGDNYSFSFHTDSMTIAAFYKNQTGFYLQNQSDFDPTFSSETSTYYQFPNMKLVGAALQFTYVFSPKDFKIHSILDQSDVQKKSSGSWLMSGGASTGEIDYDRTGSNATDQQIQAVHNTDVSHYEFVEANIKFGYGYNLVSKSGFYGAIAILFGQSLYRAQQSKDKSTLNSSSDSALSAIVGLGYNGKKGFAGLSIVNHSATVRYEAVSVAVNHQIFEIFAGYRF